MKKKIIVFVLAWLASAIILYIVISLCGGDVG